MATVIVSFAAAFGGSVFVFDTILGFKGVDYSVPLLAFLFLVALGVDYNIFLTSRAGRRPPASAPERACSKPSPPPVASSPRQVWSWRPRSRSSPHFRW